MNDDELRNQAEERLLTAELAAVLADERPRAARTWQPLYIAAMVLLGAFVAIGVAWLARTDRDEAQSPAFDPVDPWYEHEWPYRPMLDALMRPGHAAEAPEGVDEFVITLRDEDSEELVAVLDRPVVRRLALFWRNDAATPNVNPKLWQRITTRPELEVLMLSGKFAMAPARVRDLRLAPALRYVSLLSGAVTFDGPTGQALAESVRLRGVSLEEVGTTAEGLAGLASLPSLEALILQQRLTDLRPLMRVVSKLRPLRALSVIDVVPDTESVQLLAGMQHLRALVISKVDDSVLKALPTQLESLGLVSLEGCTAEGVDALRRLTKLRRLRLLFGVSLPVQRALPGALADLPLERFESLDSSLDAATSQALQSRPKLRWLTMRANGRPLAETIASIRALEHLEVLDLYVERLPEPDQLAPLRDHATLRRIQLRPRHDQQQSIPVEVIAALRASVHAQVEVMPR